MLDESSTRYALLATQNALLGVITPELRAVVVKTDQCKNIFYIRFYYDGLISEDQIEEWNCAITEATADLTLHSDEEINRIDYPHPIPIHGSLAYLRKEPYMPLGRSVLHSDFISKRELINFKKPIGIFLKPGNLESFPTYWGIVHYGEKGSHIIPARPEMAVINQYRESYSLSSIQRALLGRVTPELHNVITQVAPNGDHVFIRFYYDIPAPASVIQEWECALSEVIADFGSGFSFDVAIEYISEKETPFFKGRYAYLRNHLLV